MTKRKRKTRIALGMSGGVDSSLSAHLLVEQGYDVTGVYLECWRAERASGCRTEEDRADALKVALKLKIPFQVLEFKKAYKDKVVEYFFAEYKAGRTPNPDVVCNKEIKFGLFYDWAMKQGFDYVATGHYAKTDGQHLIIPKDTHKDQTYFMYQLTEDKLKHILLPLSNLTKKEVRNEAQKRKIHVARKKDSVGICFIGDIDVHQFIDDRLGENPGKVVDVSGNVIGRHKGLWFYTVGQRHGFTISSSASIKQSDGGVMKRTKIPPLYVLEKDVKKNQLVVGLEEETKKSEFKIHDFCLINKGLDFSPIQDKLLVRIRHTGKLLAGSLERISTSERHSYLVTLNQPAKGIAAGQSAVFYYDSPKKEALVVGGGIIA